MLLNDRLLLDAPDSLTYPCISSLAQVDTQEDDDTSLFRAVERNNASSEMVSLMLKADPELAVKTTSSLDTLLHVCQTEEVADILLQHGANVNARNALGD